MICSQDSIRRLSCAHQIKVWKKHRSNLFGKKKQVLKFTGLDGAEAGKVTCQRLGGGILRGERCGPAGSKLRFDQTLRVQKRPMRPRHAPLHTSGRAFKIKAPPDIYVCL